MGDKILDSGSRREFSTGAVRDISENKGRMDLLPFDTLSAMTSYYEDNENDVKEFSLSTIFYYVNSFVVTRDSVHIVDLLCSFIKHAYDDINTAIIEYSKHVQAGANKYSKYNWNKGLPTHCFLDSGLRHGVKYLRSDNDEPHDRAFLWNFICLLWTLVHHPELDDIFYGNKFDPATIDAYNEQWSDENETINLKESK